MGRVIRHAKENTRELEELHSKGLEFLQDAQFSKAMIFGRKLLKKAQLYESLLLIGKAYSLMGFCCYMNNDLNQAMVHYETAQKSLSVKENIKGKSEELISVLNSLGTLYKLKGELWKSMQILNSSIELSEKLGIDNPAAFNNLGTLFFSNKQYYKAIEYYGLACKLTDGSKVEGSGIKFQANKAHAYIKIGELGIANRIYRNNLQVCEENKEFELSVASLKGIGKIALKRGQLMLAEAEFLRALSFSKEVNFHFHQVDILQNLSIVYSRTNRLEQEEGVLIEAINVKGATNNTNYGKSLNMLKTFYEGQGRYNEASLVLEKLITFLKDKRKNERENNLYNYQKEFGEQMFDRFLNQEHRFRKSLKKKNNELSQVVLNQNRLRIRINSLRGQLEPGYLFNTLQDIQKYAIDGDNIMASDYIADLASLMRRVLRNSRQAKVSINDELELVQNYLQLEKRRGNYAFDFTIHVDPALDADKVVIPPFLFQNLVKKAVVKSELGEKEEFKILIRSAKNDMFFHLLHLNGKGTSQHVVEEPKQGHCEEWQTICESFNELGGLDLSVKKMVSNPYLQHYTLQMRL